jgi:hypothetical protein
MEITDVYRPVNRVASVVVTFANVPVVTSEQELRFLAYRAAGETPESCFGSRVERFDHGVVKVTIHRD